MSGLYVVQKIVGKRIRDGNNLQYKVKWKNYDSAQNTWQPVKNLKNVQKMVKEFESRNKDKLTAKEDKISKTIKKVIQKVSKKNQRKNSQHKNGSRKSSYIKFDEGLKIAKRKSDRIIKRAQMKKNENQAVALSQSESEAEDEQAIQQTQHIQCKPTQIIDNTDVSEQINLGLNLVNIASRIISATEEKKKSFTILQITKGKNGEGEFYLVEDSESNKQYKQRQYVLRNLPMELIAFYEKQLQHSKQIK